MTKERLAVLLQKTGPIAPQGFAAVAGDLGSDASELLPAACLQEVLDLHRVPEDKKGMLLKALDEANAVPELVELAHVMAKDAVRSLIRCTVIGHVQPKPQCLTGFARDAFGFLFTQMCVIEGRKALRSRGVPETYDLDIPERMTRKQLEKFVTTGDINFDDYQWDINFYCCGIFLLDRFYFIPYRWWGSPQAWRHVHTGKVVAVWEGGARVRRDGQLDGVNGVFDDEAFETVYEETERSVTANPVSPEGTIRKEPITLDKSEWQLALKEGDYLLALHIPGGEGYTTERVRKSCMMALEFYQTYYPEYAYAGFWSESWLYDPGLARLLGPERNISRVQRQFYCYPTMEGDRMARKEMRHDPETAARSTLTQGMLDAWARGERFHTTGMFLLREEVPDVGGDPYWRDL